jgi:ureidoglycolate lyase
MTITIAPVTRKDFAPYGDLLSADGDPDMIINQGRCERYHDRARMDLGGGSPGVSVFHAKPCELPYTLEMVERHPLGNQCFMPMTEHPFLVIVASDDGGKPVELKAFMIPSHMGVNIYRNVWHGVLTPLYSPGLFSVIDRVSGDGSNLEEYFFDTAHIIKD